MRSFGSLSSVTTDSAASGGKLTGSAGKFIDLICSFTGSIGKSANCLAEFVSSKLPFVLFGDFFLGFLVGFADTVPGTAKPLNSQLQLSHNRL